MPLPRGRRLTRDTVAIAGAGIGGLTAALALLQQGMRVRVYERAPRLEAVGAGIQISPNAHRVLDGLGLGPALRAVSVAPGCLVIRAFSGRVLTRLPLGRAIEERHHGAYLVVRRADLQRVLLEAVEAQDAGAVLLDAAVTGFEERGDLVLRSAGGEHPAALLVGADGVRSHVREQLVGDGPPRFAGQAAWRGLAATSELPEALRANETHLWLGPGAHLVHYPLDAGAQVNVVAILEGDAVEGWSAPGEGRDLLGRLEGLSGDARRLLEAVPHWQTWSLADRPAAPPRGHGRVTLLGDAFHPTLPFLAQGGALAIEDAAVLAREVRSSPDDLEGAARRYEAARAPRRARAAVAARRQGTIYHLAGLPAWARDLALRVAPPGRLSARQDWLYGWRA